jgi:hypothetical protein
MCDEPSRANGGCCGECCPLPKTATGLYKWLIVIAVCTSLNALLSLVYMISDPTGGAHGFVDAVFLVSRVADLFALASFACCWCVVSIICCKAEAQDWLSPLKTFAKIIVAVIIVLQSISLGISLMPILAIINDDGRSNRMLRALRIVRLLPLIELVCLSVLFCKVRAAAKLSVVAPAEGIPMA